VDVGIWAWVGFVGLIVFLLALDLFVFHRDAHEVSFREATKFSIFWISLGLAFGVVVYFWLGAQAGGEYLAGYLIEKSLSVDNIFVFALIFTYFGVPAKYQHRVLFWASWGRSYSARCSSRAGPPCSSGSTSRSTSSGRSWCSRASAWPCTATRRCTPRRTRCWGSSAGWCR
jgi:hypothetical protein